MFKHDYYEEGISYMDIMKRAMRTKLCLIRYYYTQFHLQSDIGGGPIYRPLFFDYPTDAKAYENTTNNVLIGPALKVSHLADKLGVNETEFYFPEGTYCNIINLQEKCFNVDEAGETKTLPSKAYDSYVHLRYGNAIFL